VTNRPLTEAEAKEALDYHPFARDAVVFAVHTPNPVLGLSTAQIRDIYGGTVTDWQQVGGSAGPIIVLDRDADESMRRLVLIKLLEGRPVQAQAITLAAARDMIAALEKTPSAIGYSSLGLLRIQRPRDVQMMTLDGVTANSAAVAGGAYPWELTFGLVHGREASPSVRRFVDWVQGPAGRRVLEGYDYVAVAR